MKGIRCAPATDRPAISVGCRAEAPGGTTPLGCGEHDRSKDAISALGLLLCDECGQHYVIKTQPYYDCSTHINRGPEMCRNSRLVKRDRLEEVVLRLVFEEVFSPETVAFVAKKVNDALARQADPPTAARKRKEAELANARTELENIKEAIRQYI